MENGVLFHLVISSNKFVVQVIFPKTKSWINIFEMFINVFVVAL